MACVRARGAPSPSTLSHVYFVCPCTVYSRLTGLHTSWGVSSFLSCHRSEGITDKPPCSTTWFCGDMGHQACGTTDFTCCTVFLPKNTSLLRPFLLHGSSSCCESSVSLESFVVPIFQILLHALEFCSCLSKFSQYRGCCVLWNFRTPECCSVTITEQTCKSAGRDVRSFPCLPSRAPTFLCCLGFPHGFMTQPSIQVLEELITKAPSGFSLEILPSPYS